MEISSSPQAWTKGFVVLYERFYIRRITHFPEKYFRRKIFSHYLYRSGRSGSKEQGEIPSSSIGRHLLFFHDLGSNYNNLIENPSKNLFSPQANGNYKSMCYTRGLSLKVKHLDHQLRWMKNIVEYTKKSCAVILPGIHIRELNQSDAAIFWNLSEVNIKFSFG